MVSDIHYAAEGEQGRAAALGGPCGRWAAGVQEHKGPIGLRTVMGLLVLSDNLLVLALVVTVLFRTEPNTVEVHCGTTASCL